MLFLFSSLMPIGKRASAFCICLQSIALCNCLVICFLLPLRLLWNIGELVAKKYFIDYRTANTIQLIVAIKGDFSGLFFY